MGIFFLILHYFILFFWNRSSPWRHFLFFNFFISFLFHFVFILFNVFICLFSEWYVCNIAPQVLLGGQPGPPLLGGHCWTTRTLTSDLCWRTSCWTQAEHPIGWRFLLLPRPSYGPIFYWNTAVRNKTSITAIFSSLHLRWSSVYKEFSDICTSVNYILLLRWYIQVQHPCGRMTLNLTLMLLVQNLTDTEWCKKLKNDWNPGTLLLIW